LKQKKPLKKRIQTSIQTCKKTRVNRPGTAVKDLTW